MTIESRRLIVAICFLTILLSLSNTLLKEQWHYSFNAPIRTDLRFGNLLGDEKLEFIFGTDDGTLYIIDTVTNLTLWSYKGENVIRSSPVIADIDDDGEKEVVVSFLDGKIVAVSPQTSKELWSLTLDAIPSSEMSIGDGNQDGIVDILVGSEEGILFVIEGNRGIIQWQFQTERTITAQPFFYDFNVDNVYEIVVASESGTIYVLDSKEKRPLWEFSAKGGISAMPLIKNIDSDISDEILFGTSSGLFYVVDYESSNYWTFDGKKSIQTPPVLLDTDNNGKNEIIFGNEDGTVYALSSQQNKTLWEAMLRYNVRSRPAVIDLNKDGINDVLVATFDDDIVALSGKDGTILWRYMMQNTVVSSLRLSDIDEDGLYELFFASLDTNIYVFDTFVSDDDFVIYYPYFLPKNNEVSAYPARRNVPVRLPPLATPVVSPKATPPSKTITPTPPTSNTTTSPLPSIEISDISDNNGLVMPSLDLVDKSLITGEYKMPQLRFNCTYDSDCPAYMTCDYRTHKCVDNTIVPEASQTTQFTQILINMVLIIILAFVAMVMIVIPPLLEHAGFRFMTFSEKASIISYIFFNKRIRNLLLPSIFRSEVRTLLKELLINEIDNRVNKRKKSKKKKKKSKRKANLIAVETYLDIWDENIKDYLREEVAFKDKMAGKRFFTEHMIHDLEALVESLGMVTEEATKKERSEVNPDEDTDTLRAEELRRKIRELEQSQVIDMSDDEALKMLDKIKKLDEKAQLQTIEKKRWADRQFVESMSVARDVFAFVKPWKVEFEDLDAAVTTFTVIEMSITVKDHETCKNMLSYYLEKMHKVLLVKEKYDDSLIAIFSGMHSVTNARFALHFKLVSDSINCVIVAESIAFGQKIMDALKIPFNYYFADKK